MFTCFSTLAAGPGWDSFLLPLSLCARHSLHLAASCFPRLTQASPPQSGSPSSTCPTKLPLIPKLHSAISSFPFNLLLQFEVVMFIDLLVMICHLPLKCKPCGGKPPCLVYCLVPKSKNGVTSIDPFIHKWLDELVEVVFVKISREEIVNWSTNSQKKKKKESSDTFHLLFHCSDSTSSCFLFLFVLEIQVSHLLPLISTTKITSGVVNSPKPEK